MVREALFADSILESSWAQRSRRSLSTLTSFALEAVVVGVLILLSLLKTVVMPAVQTVSTPVFVGRVTRVATTAQPHPGRPATAPANPTAIRFMHPSHVPVGIDASTEEPVADPGSEVGIIASGPAIGIDGPAALLPGMRAVMPAAPRPILREFRTSSMLEGSLIRRVQPVYPSLAKGARIQGPVVLIAVISKAGTIENLRVVSGHPMLVSAAIDAVKEWRYRPYVLNNEAIEVETQITVNFYLGGN
jgi:periplasmic protein TonB